MSLIKKEGILISLSIVGGSAIVSIRFKIICSHVIYLNNEYEYSPSPHTIDRPMDRRDASSVWGVNVILVYSTSRCSATDLLILWDDSLNRKGCNDRRQHNNISK